ncbi:hypothetical protein K402DRAFT_389613 [Aulographum hederae CBS 113979]|uniref:Uncharacterized protein n=1 Tax=Aulographum hederae CBS 113979 TaxID=1176131 RepID=A0A6G1HBT7_9PEZI|nr:hypothetical protein K402DRAFT_389613 [Aulographum hederae CBS 113979]
MASSHTSSAQSAATPNSALSPASSSTAPTSNVMPSSLNYREMRPREATSATTISVEKNNSLQGTFSTFFDGNGRAPENMPPGWNSSPGSQSKDTHDLFLCILDMQGYNSEDIVKKLKKEFKELQDHKITKGMVEKRLWLIDCDIESDLYSRAMKLVEVQKVPKNSDDSAIEERDDDDEFGSSQGYPKGRKNSIGGSKNPAAYGLYSDENKKSMGWTSDPVLRDVGGALSASNMEGTNERGDEIGSAKGRSRARDTPGQSASSSVSKSLFGDPSVMTRSSGRPIQ